MTIKPPGHDDELADIAAINSDSDWAIDESSVLADARFRDLAELLPEIVFEIDLSGRVTFINHQGLLVSGRSRADYEVGIDFMDHVHPEDRERCEEANAAVLRGERDGADEYRFMRTDGSSFPVMARTTPIFRQSQAIGLRGLIFDISEREMAERALRDSEETLAGIVNALGDGVIATDADENVVRMNPAAERMTRWPYADARGKPIDEVFQVVDTASHASLLKEGERALRAAVQSPAPVEALLIDREDEERHIELRFSLLRDAAGGQRGSVYVFSDLTERRKLERQLLMAQRMESVGRLAGGIAHDFNNLLGAITCYADLLKKQLADSDPNREDVEAIAHATNRAADLTRQLLAFSRRQILQPRVLDLNDMVSGIDKILHRGIGEDVELKTELGEELGMIRADPGQVETVIMNLAVNARDAMVSGGNLSIKTSNVTIGEEVAAAPTTPTTLVAGDYVLLEMRDSGDGMDSNTRNRIFEPFFTTKGLGRGTGLGLSIVYGIVEQSAGTIDVDSGDEGTTFKVYFPRIPETPSSIGEGYTPAFIEREISETVLVVEDEDMLRNLVSRILRRKGYQVMEASHGHEAIEVCQHYEGPIDLLVTDVVMPAMSGRELARRLIGNNPSMRVLYMSGYTDDSLVLSGGLDSGVDGDGPPFIQKPFTPTELADEVREALDGPYSSEIHLSDLNLEPSED